MQWIDIKTGRKPEQGQEIFLDGGEEPPSWGRFKTIGKFHYIVTIDSSGEEELDDYNSYERWLDESPNPEQGIEAVEVLDWVLDNCFMLEEDRGWYHYNDRTKILTSAELANLYKSV